MKRKIALVGASGFIGKNLAVRLSESSDIETFQVTRQTPIEQAKSWIQQSDCIINTAGANRVNTDDEFVIKNNEPVSFILEALKGRAEKPKILHLSSSRAGDGTAYGHAKLETEKYLLAEAKALGIRATVFRPPNVFGKWSRPNYNSAVATFCHNIARGLPITINDSNAILKLVYIDDLVDVLLAQSQSTDHEEYYNKALQLYETTVGELAKTLGDFASQRHKNIVDDVGHGLKRALYATYISSLPTDLFSYEIESHVDPRGSFSEVLKTQAAGQFSFFSAHPGVTRGGHYHHSKVEKFLVVHGTAKFRFRHIVTNETVTIEVSSSKPSIVETIPGWAHDVTNTGHEIMVSLVWANEVFQKSKPDTFVAQL